LITGAAKNIMKLKMITNIFQTQYIVIFLGDISSLRLLIKRRYFRMPFFKKAHRNDFQFNIYFFTQMKNTTFIESKQLNIF